LTDDLLDPTSAARLYSVATALSGALTAVDVAGAVFASVSELGASSTGLWLVEAGTVRFVGGAGVSEDIPDRVAVVPLESDLPAAEVIRTGRIVTYASVEERNRRWPVLTGLGTLKGPTAVLPLVVPRRALGCLHINYPEATGPDPFDLPFLEGLAGLSAAALDRAQLHDAQEERQQFLLDASAAVAHAGGFAESLQRLASVAVPRLADLCLIDVAERSVSSGPGAIRRMAAVHADPAKAPLVAELLERYAPAAGGHHPAAEAMAEGRSLWRNDMPDDYLRSTTRDQHHFELTRQLQLTSFMCVPLVVGGLTLGAITLVSAGSGRRFGADDLALAEDLAYRVCDVVAAARRHDLEHEVAHVLQTLLMPAGLPDVPGLMTCARYLTARPDAEAGGDFYDLVVLPSGRVGFVIGDVEGHDPVAAAIMGQLRSAMRALAGQLREPHLLIDALRWSWDLLGFQRMATCLVGRLDPGAGTLVLCGAGHPPPVVVDAEGRADLVAIGGSPPLGAPAGRAVDTEMELGVGATLFLYTDGLVEGGSKGIDVELDDLCALLAGSAGRPLDELCEQVIATRSDRAERRDDIAVLALRRVSGGVSHSEVQLPFDLRSVGEGRRWVQSQLADWTEDGRSAATLVASELVANAMLHARTDCTVMLHRDQSESRITVLDGDERLPEIKTYSRDAPTGRGLRLVARLSREWGIDPHPGGKAVWAVVADGAWPSADGTGPAGARLDPTAADAGLQHATIEVRLLGVPVALLREAQEHHDELVRELAFVAGSRHISARLQEMAKDVADHFAKASEGIRAELRRVSSGGERTVDLHVKLSDEGWAALQRLTVLLEEVDEHCARLELLTLSSSPAVRRLREWYQSEVGRQFAGEAPTPWEEAAGF
jgi:serine/threonine-protein kinase RsbW